ncbi:MAG: YggS family pyridoxal phosphate-dependent enzyme [Verrucomicrobiota bacterium]|jgi:pyridoxal phosphate enzyme (YggS family)|nr:YggS family pyridoxal phosphate-dependent enzyme [Verrucomicrobiota bacterium]
METDRPVADILAEVKARIAAACAKTGRKPDTVEIIGVTKTHGPDVVREAWEAGIRLFGENKVQEAAWKIPESVGGPEWHLIGHLQRNKVRHALELFSVIHSVDSVRLLEQLERDADESGRRPEILLEVNVSGESSKDGLPPGQVPEVIEAALGCRNLTLTGLMTMAPFSPDPEHARPVFARLRTCRDQWEQAFGIGLPNLSMGMSNDYLVAVEEGATWVRLGTVLFGHRPKWRPQREDADRWEP